MQYCFGDFGGVWWVILIIFFLEQFFQFVFQQLFEHLVLQFFEYIIQQWRLVFVQQLVEFVFQRAELAARMYRNVLQSIR